MPSADITPLYADGLRLDVGLWRILSPRAQRHNPPHFAIGTSRRQVYLYARARCDWANGKFVEDLQQDLIDPKAEFKLQNPGGVLSSGGFHDYFRVKHSRYSPVTDPSRNIVFCHGRCGHRCRCGGVHRSDALAAWEPPDSDRQHHRRLK